MESLGFARVPCSARWIRTRTAQPGTEIPLLPRPCRIISRKSPVLCATNSGPYSIREKRESRRTPSWINSSALEDELQRKFKLTHTGGRAGGCIMLNVGNDAVARTIDTSSAVLVVVKAKRRVIEHIECIHPELELDPFYQR